MWFFALFLAWPLIEIGLFVTLGGALGLWLTLAVVLGTAMLGTALLRRLGLQAAELRGQVNLLRDPVAPVAASALLVLAALLLILPGFLTDGLGLVLLLPPVRYGLVAVLGRRFREVTEPPHPGSARRADGLVIDGEFIEVDSDRPQKTPPDPRSVHRSGWTQD